jgi:hypothetical protein
MDQYQHDIMTGHINDISLLPQSMPIDSLNYQLHENNMLIPSSIKDEPFESGYVGSFEDVGLPEESRSYSCSSVTSLSMSPPLNNHHPELFAPQLNNLSLNGLDQVSPTTTDFSRRESEDESQRAEASSEAH